MKLTHLAFAFSILCPTALAQATQLKKLEPLVGDWQISGTFKPTLDGEDIPVTTTASGRWVLGGHFLKQETIVDLGEGMPDIAMITFTGWDNETQRYVSFEVFNDGDLASVETFIPDDDTILTARTRLREGQLVVERSVTKLLGDGTHRFETQTAIGDGPFFTIVQGTARRTSAAGSAQAVEASASFAPPAPEMAVLGKMSGEYRSQGWVPAPVAPEMGITGTHTVRLIFGGTVQEHHVRIEPGVEAFRYTAWSPADNCYNVIAVRGDIEGDGLLYKTQLRQVDDRTFVEGGTLMDAGQLKLARGVLTCDAQGSIAQWVADVFGGTGETQRVYSHTLSYRKIR